MSYINNTSYVNNMSYINNISYINNMSYLCRLYELYKLCVGEEKLSKAKTQNIGNPFISKKGKKKLKRE